MIQKLTDKLPPVLKNKYILVLIAAAVWFIFFDQNNLIQQYRLSSELNDLKRDRDYYKEEIKRDSLNIWRLRHDMDALERYAREKYLMKKKNEDIFIIPD